MSNVKTAMFHIRFCDDCKDLEIIGYDCVKCQLDKVIKAKVEMNLSFVKEIETLKAENEKLKYNHMINEDAFFTNKLQQEEIDELEKNLKDAIEVIEPIVKYYDSTDIERGHEEETDFKDPEYCIWEDCKEFLQTIKEKK